MGTGKYRWNWNAATLDMLGGKYSQAADKYSGETENAEDSLFWGKVLYDAGHFPESLDALTQHEDDLDEDDEEYSDTVKDEDEDDEDAKTEKADASAEPDEDEKAFTALCEKRLAELAKNEK